MALGGAARRAWGVARAGRGLGMGPSRSRADQAALCLGKLDETCCRRIFKAKTTQQLFQNLILVFCAEVEWKSDSQQVILSDY